MRAPRSVAEMPFQDSCLSAACAALTALSMSSTSAAWTDAIFSSVLGGEVVSIVVQVRMRDSHVMHSEYEDNGHSRRIYRVNELALGRFDKLIVDKKAGGLGVLDAVGGRQLNREIRHCGDVVDTIWLAMVRGRREEVTRRRLSLACSFRVRVEVEVALSDQRGITESRPTRKGTGQEKRFGK